MRVWPVAALLKEGAAIDLAKDAFGHLKAIGHSAEAKPLLDKAGVVPDDGVVALWLAGAFLAEPDNSLSWERSRPVVESIGNFVTMLKRWPSPIAARRSGSRDRAAERPRRAARGGGS